MTSVVEFALMIEKFVRKMAKNSHKLWSNWQRDTPQLSFYFSIASIFVALYGGRKENHTLAL